MRTSGEVRFEAVSTQASGPLAAQTAAVEAEALSKVYRVYASPWDRLFEIGSRRPRHRDFHALEAVSFSLPRGEGLALLGENGAGKSTLLKLLAGITQPSSGRATIRGRLASILELGSGFHPDFTGRQNIVLNAAMLGLEEREVRERTPAIEEFSELGDFLDQPVKVYSTGMAMRLGFAIAAQVEPDVLIVDEALAVGDGYFQKKCIDRLERFVSGGGTLLFCSHAMYYVSAFCQRALWLRRGKPEALGPVRDVVREYESFLVAKSAAMPPASTPATNDEAATPTTTAATMTPAHWTRVDIVANPAPNAAPSSVPLVASGTALAIEIEWESQDPALLFHVGLGINRVDGLEVAAFSTLEDGVAAATGALSYRARLEIPTLPIVKGDFVLYAFLLDERGLHIYDQRLIRPAFAVSQEGYRFGLINVEHSWNVEWSSRSPRDLSVKRNLR